jgi:5-methylcytosine-specific restriction endonuclease McrA
MSYTKKDKSLIAHGQKQVGYREDFWTGRRTVTGYYCAICGRRFSLSDLEVDHIKPRSKRGSEKPSNLQLVCPRCNKLKGSKVMRQSSPAKRKGSTVNRKHSTTKRKTTSVKGRSSTVTRKQR